MKTILYIIAGLLAIIWIFVFKPNTAIHLLLLLAGIILFINLIFGNRLSNKSIKGKK